MFILLLLNYIQTTFESFSNIPQSTLFKYYYIPEIDEDGTGALVRATNLCL
jgi:hypothetical protein